MNATQAKEQTAKQSQRLFHKYTRQGIRHIKRVIREAQKHGNSHATAYITNLSWENENVVHAVRKYLVDFLESNGFYVRIYTFAEKMEIMEPDEIYFAWGDDIERFREIDKIQEKMHKEKYNVHN